LKLNNLPITIILIYLIKKMYNIDLYSYWKEPYTRTRKHTIHPLDEPGLEKYYSDQSHLVHYLHRTDPFVFKSIVGVDYETLVKQQEDKIREMNADKSLNTMKNLKIEKTQTIPKKTIQFEETKNFEGNQNLNNENTMTNGIHVTNFENDTQGMMASQNNLNQQSQINYYNKSIRPNNIYSEDVMELDRPFDPRNPTTRHFFRPYRKPKNFYETYGYNNTSMFKNNKERYQNDINNLKRNTRMMSASNYRHNYLDNINTERPMSTAFKSYNQRLATSMNKFTNTGISQEEAERIENGNLYKTLCNQTSVNFRSKYKLPDVCKIANQRQVIRNHHIGNSKEMGERYNPYSLIPPSKNRTGRNFVGDLFKH